MNIYLSIPELKQVIELAENASQQDSSLSKHVIKLEITTNKFNDVMKIEIWSPSHYQECNGKHLKTTQYLQQ